MSKSLRNPLKLVVLGLLVLGFISLNMGNPGFFVSRAHAAPAQSVKCVQCGKEIKPGERFLKTSDGKIFCSEKCYQASLPLCSVCQKMLSGSFFRSKDGKNLYCSEKCLSTTWPSCSLCKKKVKEGTMLIGAGGKNFFCGKCAELPRCFCCDMPAKCAKLKDGRFICPECAKTAVMEEQDIIAIIKEVRLKMNEKLSMSTDHQIEYKVVDFVELSKLVPEKQEGIELGLFRFEETNEKTISTKSTIAGDTITKVEDEKISRKYAIYVLYGMTKDKLIEVAAHELAHDWMKASYPRIADLKVKEGFAEYAASKVNALYGRESMNGRMQDNPSDIYGGGYRFIAGIAKKGEDNLKAFLEKYNKDSPGN